ncbi:MAG: discoidin domain-containing protein [Kiritimatiellia bacterium]
MEYCMRWMAMAFAAAALTGRAAETVDLSGKWSLALDAQDGGTMPAAVGGVLLPGALQNQGFGEDVSTASKWIGGIVDRSWYDSPRYAKDREPGSVRIPFWLQPDKRYIGPAWYERKVTVPTSFADRRAVLHLERPHWVTTVWLDGKEMGTRDSLSVAHEYDLGTVTPGEHTLRIRVDNRMVIDVGENSHSMSDHTQGNWNGVVGKIELRATPRVWLDDVQVWPDAGGRKARVTARIGNATGAAGQGSLEWSCGMTGGQFRTQWCKDGGDVEWEIEFAEGTPRWDEFSPALQTLKTGLKTEQGVHVREDRFGLRTIATEGTQFTVNGRKTFFRGTLECCIFPLTGYPPTDVAAWRRIVRICKAHGLNMIRFHSWCPPEAAFVAADEEGFYYQVECASWANQSTTIGDGKPIDIWIYAEADRILRAYGNHPSFMLMPYGNEPGGGNHRAFLSKWVEHCKARDQRRLYTTAAGWPEMPVNQYHNSPDPRLQRWGEGLRSRLNHQVPTTRPDFHDYIAARTVPVVSHEIGQWCVYPNFDEMAKYTGPLKAKNFGIFKDSLDAAHMGDQARDFLLASGKLQALCYKEEIEAALRTKGMGGFQLLDLHDFPGQGTALVGVLDPFWDEKGYITAAEYRRFAGPTVPLARLDARTFTTAQTLHTDVELSHFGAAPIAAKPVWTLRDARGKAVREGRLPDITAPVDNGIPLGVIDIPLAGLPAPAKYNLEVALTGTDAANDWDVWVYPETAPDAAAVLISTGLDPATRAKLLDGASVLLLPPAARIESRGIETGFTPVFWNTAWARGQKPETLGILCKPEHPVFAQFPTEYHQNWQWWEVIKGAKVLVLDDQPAELRPLVQSIDTWFENRRLGLLVEARVGKGRLMISGMNLSDDLATRPVARQFRASVLRYMASPAFAPKVALTLEQVETFLKPAPPLERFGAKVTASGAQPDYPAANAIDGNPATIWHTRYEPAVDPHPHSITLDLGATRKLAGVKYTPRPDLANGRIAKFEIRTSADGVTWSEPVASGTWPDGAKPQTVRFPETSARHIRLTALSEVNGGPWAAVAELDVVVAE